MSTDLSTPVDARTSERLRVLDTRLALLEARIATEHLDRTLDLLALRFNLEASLLDLLFQHELDLNRVLVGTLGDRES